MSNLIKDMTNSVQLSLQTENWLPAITIALTLPDICAKIDGSFGTTSQARYAAWFESHVATLPTEVGPESSPYKMFMSGNDCYALRCAFLHEGNVEIKNHHRAKENIDMYPFRVSDTEPWSIAVTCAENSRVMLSFDPRYFCNDICRAVNSWLDSKSGDVGIQDKITNLPRILKNKP